MSLWKIVLYGGLGWLLSSKEDEEDEYGPDEPSEDELHEEESNEDESREDESYFEDEQLRREYEDQGIELSSDSTDIPLHFNTPPGEYYEKPERITQDGNKKVE